MKNEKRKLTFKNIEIRSGENEGKKFVEGLIPYDSESVPMWGTTEIIDRTAFHKTLADNTEIRALFNHDDSKVLGSNISKTLVLENTETGLICRCELPKTSYADDLFEIITRGDVRTMSFGFTPVRSEDSDNGKKRTLKEVKLHEVSYGVAFPAYPETTSVTYMRGLEKNNIDIDKLNEVLDKENKSDDDKVIIKNTIDILSNFVKKDETETVVITTVPETIVEDTTALQFQIEAEILAA